MALGAGGNRPSGSAVRSRMFVEPFLGSAAVARGAVTRGQLRGPRFRRLLPDVHVSASVPVTPLLRARAAHVLLAGRGALGGFSAAEALGASCGSLRAPAEVVLLPGHRQRPLPDLVVRRDRLGPDDTVRWCGLLTTSPERTAYDLARRSPPVEAVVALDALARVHGFDPAAVLEIARRNPGARGSAQLQEAVRLADPLADSPMETRVRVALRAGGLPPPVLQHPVGPYRLDLAYPAVGLAVEYDGREHLTPERARRDLDRQAFLTAAGWRVLRFRAATVLGEPAAIPRAVHRYLRTEAHRRGTDPVALLHMISAA